MSTTVARHFDHWDWFNNIVTRYHLVRESPQMVWGIPLDQPDAEPRRFHKRRIRFVT